MRTSNTLAILAVAMILAGEVPSARADMCPSVYPLASEKTRFFDPALAGAWEEENTGRWIFDPAGNESYNLAIPGAFLEFNVRLVKLGGLIFVEGISKPAPAGSPATYVFGRLRINGDAADVELLDSGWLRDTIAANRAIRPEHLLKLADGVALAAPTEVLQRFAASYAHDSHPWNVSFKLQRVGTEPVRQAPEPRGK